MAEDKHSKKIPSKKMRFKKMRSKRSRTTRRPRVRVRRSPMRRSRKSRPISRKKPRTSESRRSRRSKMRGGAERQAAREAEEVEKAMAAKWVAAREAEETQQGPAGPRTAPSADPQGLAPRRSRRWLGAAASAARPPVPPRGAARRPAATRGSAAPSAAALPPIEQLLDKLDQLQLDMEAERQSLPEKRVQAVGGPLRPSAKRLPESDARRIKGLITEYEELTAQLNKIDPDIMKLDEKMKAHIIEGDDESLVVAAAQLGKLLLEKGYEEEARPYLDPRNAAFYRGEKAAPQPEPEPLEERQHTEDVLRQEIANARSRLPAPRSCTCTRWEAGGEGWRMGGEQSIKNPRTSIPALYNRLQEAFPGDEGPTPW